MDSIEDLQAIVAYSDQLGEAFFAVDRDWRLVAANGIALRFAGMTLDQVVGRTYWDLIPSQAGSSNEAMLRNAMAARTRSELLAESRLHPGRYLRGIAIPLRDGLAISFRDVTEQRALEREREAQLVRSENRLRLALDATQLGTWDFDPQTQELSWDARCRTLFGVPLDAPVSYETFVQVLHPDDRDEVLAAAAAALDPNGSGVLRVEHRICDLGTGEERWIAGRGQGFFEGGRPVRLIGTSYDITERKRVERALRESEARLRTIADNIPNGMVYQVIRETDGRVRFTYVSQAVERLHGISAEAVMADPDVLDRQILDEFRPALETLRREADTAKQEISIEIPMRMPSGEVRWFHRSSAPRPLPDGLSVWDGVEIDITERKRSETALRESETRLRLALDAGRMAVWAWDGLTGTLKTSPELNRMLGFPPDHVLSIEEARSRYYPGEGERIRGAGQAAMARGERYFEVEYRSVMPDGELRWLMLRAEISLTPEGTPAGVVGVLLDVTDRKASEEALREREAVLRDALGAAAMAIFDVDHLTGQVRPSARLNEIYGYPPDRPLTVEDLRARYHPEDREHLQAVFAAANDPSVRQFEMELRLLMPDGTPRWIDGRGEYVRDEAGRVLRSRGVLLDITERKRWEERQQLLVNELNHRVKNTLATVQSIANQSLRNAATPAQARGDIEGRLIALSRAHDVLTREGWEGANLREIVAHAIEPFGQRFVVQGPDLRLLPRMALALAMALQELATNAVKYGALSNETGEVEIAWTADDHRHLALTWTERGGPAVAPPNRRGFGSRLIERSLASDLGGTVALRFEPGGVVCTIAAPLPDPSASDVAA
ncbi:MAG TPA: PAS domain S-box protein [Microvirga sp.]|nr:PAS domain S-box protein [Microvirga sp.]